MTNEARCEGCLRPRAIAVLVVLRAGAMTTNAIARRISDRNSAQTEVLILDMAREDLVKRVYNRARSSKDGVGWMCGAAGVAWLESNGLGIARGQTVIRQEVYECADASRRADERDVVVPSAGTTALDRFYDESGQGSPWVRESIMIARAPADDDVGRAADSLDDEETP